MAISVDAVSTLGDRLDHPEGVAWDPQAKVLYAGGEAGQIYRIDPLSGSQEIAGNSGGYILGVALDGRSRVYGCDMVRAEVVRLTTDGRIESYSKGTAEQPMRVPNHLVFAQDGTLYVSDSGDWGGTNGLVYRIDPEGRTEVFSREVSGFTNGLSLSPDGRHLYVVESTLPGITRVEIRRDGRAGGREIVCELPHTVPDGTAFARDGSLYIACYRPDVILRLAPGGALETVVDDWQALKLAGPTNLAFYGSSLAGLAAACLHGEWLCTLDAGAQGQPLHYPTLR